MRAWIASLSIGLSILVGITLLCERFLSWPLSVGLPLMAQTLFLMGVLYAAGRASRVFAEHASYAGVAPDEVIARMERARVRFLVFDLVLGGSAIAAGIVLLILFARTPLWSQLPGAALALGCALLIHAMTLKNRDTVHEYARHFGVKARARLLAWKRTRWSRASTTYDSAHGYELDLEILPPSAPSYRVTTTQFLRVHRSNMPAAGATIPVKYLPGRPAVVVVFLNPEDPEAW